MRIFLFIFSVLSLVLAAHGFSLAEHTGQHKSGIFFLLIGIQLLVTAALVHDHRESQTAKSPTSPDKSDCKETESSGVNVSEEQEKGS